MGAGLDTFLTGLRDRDVQAGNNVVALREGNPDQAAQANILARQTGLPADTVQRNLPEVAASTAANANAATIASNPGLQRWFSDPRNTAASHDDVPALHAVSRTLTAPAATASTGIGGFVSRMAALGARGFSQLQSGLYELGGALNEWSADNPLPWTSPDAIAANRANAVSLRARARAAAATTPVAGETTWAQVKDHPSIGNIASFGADQVAETLPSAVAAIVSLPALMASMAGSIGQQRAQNDGRSDASIGDVVKAAPTALAMSMIDRLGIGRVFGATGGNIASRVAKGIGTEAVTQGTVSGLNYTGGSLGTATGFKPGDALDAVASGATTGVLLGTGLAGAHEAIRATHGAVTAATDMNEAHAGAAFLDQTMATAEQSKLRARDPEAFRQFVDQHTDGTPVQNVYVPGETIRELMQSDAFDPRTWDEITPDLHEQVAQAEATGGDVVLPLAGVAAHLAGTPAWEAIRDNVRVDPGGMSPAEAKAFEEHYSDLIEQRGKEASDALSADQEARAPERKVFDDVFSQARQAGFNVRSAQAYADLWQQRYATRAERTGTDAWTAYKASNTTIEPELPASVQGYRKADGLDVVINAMRRGAEEKGPIGDSLLQFISKGGGVEDKGGDIASMGGDRWHREQAFRRKLIRDAPDERQGGMLGGAADTSTGYGVDDWGQRAFEAGYFPELSERPDVNQTIDAIGDELRGQPRHPEQSTSDAQGEVARAADDLRQYLGARGLDPDTASRAEIDKALEERDADRSLHQSEIAKATPERNRLTGIKRSLDQGERGRIDFHEDGRKVIRLFASHDLSTLLHEGAGHLWLEELRQDAEAAPEGSQLRDDWNTVRKWFADNGHVVEDFGDIPTEAHELWARGAERYLMEGKAPTDALSSAFSAFRSWLLRIYQVVANLNAPISNEIRGVMDRLLATDQALTDAQERAQSQALFPDAKQAGMTDAEFRDYRDTVQGARTEAFDALLYRTMETVRKARTKEWREERARVRESIAADIGNRPEFRALAKMRGRDGDGERVPLDRQAIVDEMGNDALSLIPKGVPPTVVAEGGVHPDILAEMVGMPNGRELLDRLMGIQQRENELRAGGDKRSALNEAIDELTDETMRRRHGDILSDGSIEEEALAAIHDDKRATVMAAEARALGRKSGQVPTPWLKAKQWAERIVREGAISDQASPAALARHQRNEAKAGRDAEKAMLAGDLDAAFKAKQQQMLAAALYRAARDAKDETNKIVKRLGNFAKAKTLKTMDQDYLDRIHSLLEDYDFRPRTAKERRERESFAKWAEAKLADGEEVYVPPRLADAGNVNFAKMTFEQLTGIDDMIASIAHLGRRKKEMLIAGEKRDFDDMVTRAEDGAAGLPDCAFSAERNPKPGLVGRFAAGLTNVEFMADELDNFDSNGVFNRVLVQAATEAANTKDRLRKEVLDPLASLYHDMSATDRRRLQERVVVPEFHTIHPDGTSEPTVFRRMELLSIALNTGNESNLDKMVRGERWSEDRVTAVLDRELSESDWRFVEKAWRQVDSLWPEIARVEREMSGVVPEKIEPRTVPTKFGPIQGGYWPVVYDPTRSLMAQKRYEDDASSMFGQHGKAVATPKGHTVERTDAAAPLLLSLEGVLINHVDRVTTRIAYGRYVRDALKFIRDPRIKALVDRKRGPADYAQLLPWLKGQVNDAKADTVTLAGIEHVLKQSRINATIVGLGLRLTTIFQHISYLTNSSKEIGAGWMLKGIGAAATNLGQNSDFVFARSQEMAGRAESFDQNVRDAFSQMGTRYTGGRVHDAAVRSQEFAQRIAFWGMGQFLMHGVAIPTWLGAYHKGISEGMSETDAAHYGDKVVRRAQGGGRAKDLTAFQRAPEAMRQLGMFYSYFGTMFNQQREAVRAMKRGDYRRAANTAFWVMLAEPVAVSIMKGDLPDDMADAGAWAEWVMSKVFFNLWGGIPGLRDASSAAERVASGKAPSLAKAIQENPAPVLRGGVAVAKVAEDIVHKARGDEPSERWLEHAIEAPGYFLGLPTGQVAATGDYLYGVGAGQQHPTGPVDVAHGIVKGRQQDQD